MRSQTRARVLAAGASVAVACLAAIGSAQAQSSVSLYGLIDLSVNNTQAPGGPSIKTADSGKMTTSYWGVKGTEDLGGGLSAIFALEGFLRADSGDNGRFNGDPYWARSAYVGLASPTLGTLTAGRNTTSLFVQTLLFNAFGDSFGYSPVIRHYFTSGTVTGDTGWSNSVKYASPRWGGASLTAHVAASEGNGGKDGGLSALYFSGGWGLGAAYQAVSSGATIANTKTWQLAASYDFKAAKLFGQYGRVDNTHTAVQYNITSLGASAPVGAGRVLAQWSQIDPDLGAKRNTISVGYDYFLSRRTDVYAVFMSDRISGLASGSNYGAGIRHRF